MELRRQGEGNPKRSEGRSEGLPGPSRASFNRLWSSSLTLPLPHSWLLALPPPHPPAAAGAEQPLPTSAGSKEQSNSPSGTLRPEARSTPGPEAGDPPFPSLRDPGRGDGKEPHKVPFPAQRLIGAYRKMKHTPSTRLSGVLKGPLKGKEERQPSLPGDCCQGNVCPQTER